MWSEGVLGGLYYQGQEFQTSSNKPFSHKLFGAASDS